MTRPKGWLVDPALVIALGLSAGGIHQSSAVAAGMQARSHHHTRVVANCLHPHRYRYRPDHMTQACGGDATFALRHVRYAKWTHRVARGRAVQNYNSCRPDCGAGHYVNRRVRFVLYKPRLRHGRRLFACSWIRSGESGTYTLLNQQFASACPRPHRHRS